MSRISRTIAASLLVVSGGSAGLRAAHAGSVTGPPVGVVVTLQAPDNLPEALSGVFGTIPADRCVAAPGERDQIPLTVCDVARAPTDLGRGILEAVGEARAMVEPGLIGIQDSGRDAVEFDERVCPVGTWFDALCFNVRVVAYGYSYEIRILDADVSFAAPPRAFTVERVGPTSNNTIRMKQSSAATASIRAQASLDLFGVALGPANFVDPSITLNLVADISYSSAVTVRLVPARVQDVDVKISLSSLRLTSRSPISGGAGEAVWALARSAIESALTGKIRDRLDEQETRAETGVRSALTGRIARQDPNRRLTDLLARSVTFGAAPLTATVTVQEILDAFDASVQIGTEVWSTPDGAVDPEVLPLRGVNIASTLRLNPRPVNDLTGRIQVPEHSCKYERREHASYAVTVAVGLTSNRALIGERCSSVLGGSPRPVRVTLGANPQRAIGAEAPALPETVEMGTWNTAGVVREEADGRLWCDVVTNQVPSRGIFRLERISDGRLEQHSSPMLARAHLAGQDFVADSLGLRPAAEGFIVENPGIGSVEQCGTKIEAVLSRPPGFPLPGFGIPINRPGPDPVYRIASDPRFRPILISDALTQPIILDDRFITLDRRAALDRAIPIGFMSAATPGLFVLNPRLFRVDQGRFIDQLGVAAGRPNIVRTLPEYDVLRPATRAAAMTKLHASIDATRRLLTVDGELDAAVEKANPQAASAVRLATSDVHLRRLFQFVPVAHTLDRHADVSFALGAVPESALAADGWSMSRPSTAATRPNAPVLLERGPTLD